MATKPWLFDWRSVTYLDFLEWIQEVDILLPFFKAYNERYFASDIREHSYITRSEAFSIVDGSFVSQVDDEAYNAQFLTSSQLPFPESGDLLRIIPSPIPTYPANTYEYYRAVNLSSEKGVVAASVAVSPLSFLLSLSSAVYGGLSKFFIATHFGNGGPVYETNLDNPQARFLQNWTDDHSFDISEPDVVFGAYYKSIWGQFTTRVSSIVTEWRFPRDAGPDAYFPREINSMLAPGSAGQVAKIVFASGDGIISGAGALSDQVKQLSGRIAFHDGTQWTAGTTTDGLNFNPDVIREGRPPRYGDYVGPWVLADLRDTLNMMRYTFGYAGPSNLYLAGQPFPPDQVASFQIGLVAAQSQSNLGESSVYASTHGGDAVLDRIEWHHTKPFDDLTWDASIDITIVSENAATFAPSDGTAQKNAAIADYAAEVMTVVDWPDFHVAPPPPTFPFGCAIFYSRTTYTSSEVLFGDVPGASCFKSRSNPAVSTHPWLQIKGISKRVNIYEMASRRTYATRYSPTYFETPPPYKSNFYKFNFSDSPFGYFDDVGQPVLQISHTVEGAASVLFGDYVGTMDAPTAWPEWWEVWGNASVLGSNDGTVNYGSESDAYCMIAQWNIVGGFRYSDVADAG